LKWSFPAHRRSVGVGKRSLPCAWGMAQHE
jgi:hypothetical protein